MYTRNADGARYQTSSSSTDRYQHADLLPIYSGNNFVSYPTSNSYGNSNQLVNNLAATNYNSIINNPLPLPPRSYYHSNLVTNQGNGHRSHHRGQRSSFSHFPPPNINYSDIDNSSLLNPVTNNGIKNYNQESNYSTVRRKPQRNYSLPGGIGHSAAAGQFTVSQVSVAPSSGVSHYGQQPATIYQDAIYSNTRHSDANIYSKGTTAYSNNQLPTGGQSDANIYSNGISYNYTAYRDPIYGNLPPPPWQFQNSPKLSSAPKSKRQQPIYSYVTKSQPTTPASSAAARLTTGQSSRYINSSTVSQPGTPYINPLTLTSAQPLVQRSPSNDRISTSPSTSSTSAGSVTNQRGSSTSCPPPIKRESVPSTGQLVNRSSSSAGQRKENETSGSSKSINKSKILGISKSSLINSIVSIDPNKITTIKTSSRRHSRSLSRSSLDDDDNADERQDYSDNDVSFHHFRSRDRGGHDTNTDTIILPKDDAIDSEKYNARLINDKDKSASRSKDKKRRRVLFALDSRRNSEISIIMKYFIFAVNFIIMMIGLSLTSIGFWAWKEKDYGLSNLNLDPAFGLIIFGLICAVIGGTGSMGALRENTTLLGGYAIFLTILLVTELMGGILAFIFKDWIKSQASIGLQSFIVFYRDDPDRQNLVDWIQESWLECCGIDGPKDWDMNIYFNCSSEAKGSREACGVPFSCCKSDDTDDRIFRNNQCGYDVRKPDFMGDKSLIIYEKGCLRSGEEWIESNLVSISVTTVIISIIQKYPLNRINQIGCFNAVSLWMKRKLIKIILICLSVPFIEIMGICFAQNLRADIFSQKSKWR